MGTTYDFVDIEGAPIANATAITGANFVSATSVTSVGPLVANKKAFRLKGNHHLVDNVQANLGHIPLNTTYSLCNVQAEQELKCLNQEEYKKTSDMLPWFLDDVESYEVTEVQ